MKPLVSKWLLLASVCAGPLKTQAQFPLVATAPEPAYRISTIGDGHKYFADHNPESGTATIYNLDFSVYRVLHFPAFTYGATGIQFVTQDLFDDDPSTIEFVLSSFDDFTAGVKVYREDGTALFNQSSGRRPDIFEANGQAYMAFEPSQGGLLTVYQLPGHLPCIDCHGTPAGMAVINGDDPARGLTLYPNPTAHEVMVEVQERYAKPGAFLLLLNAEGKEVGRYSLKGQSRFNFSVNGLASGVYQCVLIADGIRASAKLLVGGQ